MRKRSPIAGCFFPGGRIMSAKASFRELIESSNEILWAPCIYDCVSAKCAEQIGFKAVTISSCEQMHSFTGMPYMTQDEMFISAERIIKSTNCAVLVDGEDGGGDPLQVYRNVRRYAEAGAMAISIEDTFNHSSIGIHTIGVKSTHKSMAVRDHNMPAELWAACIQAAVEATKGTECMVVARVNGKSTMDNKGPEKFANRPGYSLDEAIRRLQMGAELGAPMTMLQNICYPGGQAEWSEYCKRVPGYHVYPDIHADHGVSDVDDVSELYKAGFQVITCHCFQKGAWKGMLEYGMHVFKDKNTIYTENDDFGHPIWQLSPLTFPEYAEKCDHWIDTYEEMKNYKGN